MTVDIPNSPAVERIREEIDARLNELQPVLAEIHQLTSLRAVLDQPTSPEELARFAALLSSSPPAAPELTAGGSQPDNTLVHQRPRGKRGTPHRAPAGHNKRRILEIVRERPGVTSTTIAEELKIRRSVVFATITRLKRSGELETYRRGLRVPATADAA
jgi:hypothetical protein